MKKLKLRKRNDASLRNDVLNNALINEVQNLVYQQISDGELKRATITISERYNLDEGLTYIISGIVVSDIGRSSEKIIGTIEVSFTHKEAIMISLGYLENYARSQARSASMSNIQM